MAPSAVDWEPSQFVACAAKGLGDLVEQAVARRVEEEPDIRDRDHRQHGRGEIRHAQQGAPGQAAVDEKRHEEREPDRERDGAERVDEIIGERLPEDRVGEHVLVIGDADEMRRTVHLRRRVEGIDERRDDRDMREGRKQHHRGQKKKPGLDAAPRKRPPSRGRLGAFA